MKQNGKVVCMTTILCSRFMLRTFTFSKLVSSGCLSKLVCFVKIVNWNKCFLINDQFENAWNTCNLYCKQLHTCTLYKVCHTCYMYVVHMYVMNPVCSMALPPSMAPCSFDNWCMYCVDCIDNDMHPYVIMYPIHCTFM